MYWGVVFTGFATVVFWIFVESLDAVSVYSWYIAIRANDGGTSRPLSTTVHANCSGQGDATS
jgi:hypothetical protein